MKSTSSENVPERRGLSDQVPSKTDQKGCISNENMNQEKESRKRNKRDYTRKRKSRKNDIGNVGMINASVSNKAEYANLIRTLKHRQEIAGLAKHPAYEKEYNENKKKINFANKEKCNIII